MKNDIRYLPFDKLTRDISSLRKQNEDDFLATKKAMANTANHNKMRQLKADSAPYWDSEAGIEGMEEAIRESATFHDLDSIDLNRDELVQCNDLAIKECIPKFIADNSINLKHSWIMPQIKAFFGNWVPVRGEDGLYSARDTLSRNATDNFARGVWYLSRWSRSDLIKDPGAKMYQLGEYNHLVPLVLSGFKLHHNIKYSEWSKKGLGNLVDEPLATAMILDIPDFTAAELLEIRSDCLIFKSGVKMGQYRDPRTAHTLYGTESYQKYPIGQVSKLAQIMLTQIWIAHPANRTKHMVLDPRNWDIMPTPLIDTSVVSNSYNSASSGISDDLIIFR